MVVITVSYKVHMTYYSESAGSIGTDGIGPCVGIIAKKTNGTTFCAHIASSIQGIDANLPSITSKTTELINKYLKNVDLVEMSCVTGNLKDKSANAIYKGITNAYGAKVKALVEGTGIYFKDGAVGVVKAETIKGTVEGPNAFDGPMDVK
ncbi:hypothetical protein DDB_G0283783 [Dictyostelium discoideum AX4]|uniref:Uncharacterized protein n=1 Tax=Dictyostelium discoideum TaxID=44689 RepID=Q54QL3_DICDI|nr:hypothetical protein DDB_G0283783 [Dictyostelium discoideum AX4]EAL65506.1 hypothetical protein DDB_G0283783 [Dictyostelium discoideum AX4]|eukprot:XP_638858.1 hypothetical protein DDB_G0283783 [Dictyostelium discoideum AX4]